MLKRLFLGAVLVCVPAFVAAPAWAQGEMHKTVYTYVSEWAVPRAMWPEMAKQAAGEHALLDKFLADGTITDYGDFVNLVHQEGAPTHGGWFQSNTIGGILRVLAAYAAQPESTFPVLAASKHWDYFLQSDADMVGMRSGTFTNGYLRVINVRVKPGQGETFDRLYKSYLEPVYKELLADGTLIYYGTDEGYVNNSGPRSVGVVLIGANVDSLDKYGAAVQAAFAKNPAALPALIAATEPGTFRSYLSSVPYMKTK